MGSKLYTHIVFDVFWFVYINIFLIIYLMQHNHYSQHCVLPFSKLNLNLNLKQKQKQNKTFTNKINI